MTGQDPIGKSEDSGSASSVDEELKNEGVMDGLLEMLV